MSWKKCVIAILVRLKGQRGFNNVVDVQLRGGSEGWTLQK